MTALTHAPRTTDPVCPSWCTGHNRDGWQEWFEYVDNSMARDHAEDAVLEGGYLVMAIQQETTTGGMDVPKVYLMENDENIESRMYTAAQARELAATILAAADRIDAEAGR